MVTHVKHSRVCLSIPNSLTISGKGHFLKAENGHEFEQTLGDGEGQGSLVCFSPWGHKESDTTEQLNNSLEVLDVVCMCTCEVNGEF